MFLAHLQFAICGVPQQLLLRVTIMNNHNRCCLPHNCGALVQQINIIVKKRTGYGHTNIENGDTNIQRKIGFKVILSLILYRVYVLNSSYIVIYTHTMMKTAPMLVSFGSRPAPPWRLFSRLLSPMRLMSNCPHNAQEHCS